MQNILSKDVLDIDVSQYLEENWPLGDDKLEQTHKLYRLVSYRRCSSWVFTILGKKVRRVFLSRVYTTIQKKFASPTGLYTHFKFSKRIGMIMDGWMDGWMNTYSKYWWWIIHTIIYSYIQYLLV